MFNKKQIVRNYVFGFFCGLILLISLSLTYYISYYEKEELGTEKIQNESKSMCGDHRVDYFIYSIYFKLATAFFAGGVFAEGLWHKIAIF